jgi:hypothetical protein
MNEEGQTGGSIVMVIFFVIVCGFLYICNTEQQAYDKAHPEMKKFRAEQKAKEEAAHINRYLFEQNLRNGK